MVRTLRIALAATIIATVGHAQAPENFNATCGGGQSCTAQTIGGFYTRYGTIVYGPSTPNPYAVRGLAGGTGATDAMVTTMLSAFLKNGYRVRSVDFPSLETVEHASPNLIFAFDQPNGSGNLWQLPLPAGQGLFPSTVLQSFWCGGNVYGFIDDLGDTSDAPVVICAGPNAGVVNQTIQRMGPDAVRPEVTITTVDFPSFPESPSYGTRAILRNSNLSVQVALWPSGCLDSQCSGPKASYHDRMFPVIGFESASWANGNWPYQLLINGSYFARCSPGCGHSYGLLMSGGTQYYGPDNLDLFKGQQNQLDAILFDKTGKASIVMYESLAGALATGNYANAVAGNYVVQNGAVVPLRMARVHEADVNESRTAIALTPDGWMWVVVVQPGDGKRSLGVSASGLTTNLIALGASDVIMLDGGGSSQMSCMVCTPSATSVAGDNTGYRPVPAALMILGALNAPQ